VPAISIDALTARYFERYDRNRDGAIGMQGAIHGSGGRGPSEAAVHSSRFHDPKTGRDFGKWNASAPDFIRFPGARALVLEDQFVSSERFFFAADKDGDRRVTRIEVADAIRLFDTDKDGKLSDAERAMLGAEYGEVRGTVSYSFRPQHFVRALQGDVDDLGGDILAD
jgi:hypothetical protein